MDKETYGKYTYSKKVIKERIEYDYEYTCDICGFKETNTYRLSDHMKKHKKQDLHNELWKLKEKCKWETCGFPSMGSASYNGSVEFENKDQAEKLLELLRENSSYYYTYTLDYDDPGKYNVIPYWRTDHDNEPVYTADITKKDEEGGWR